MWLAIKTHLLLPVEQPEKYKHMTVINKASPNNEF